MSNIPFPAPSSIRSISAAQPLIHALRALGHRVVVDEADDDGKSTWLDVGPLCVKVHPEHGYGLYLESNQAFGAGPDETFQFGQVESLLERMRGLLAKKE
jgi:hypothetical protein